LVIGLKRREDAVLRSLHAPRLGQTIAFYYAAPIHEPNNGHGRFRIDYKPQSISAARVEKQPWLLRHSLGHGWMLNNGGTVECRQQT
jgi:hypothetical protein